MSPFRAMAAAVLLQGGLVARLGPLGPCAPGAQRRLGGCLGRPAAYSGLPDPQEASVSESTHARPSGAAPPGRGPRRVVPLAPPAGARDLEAVADFLRASQRLLVITGAGCSTESNIPDYRSPGGAYSSGFKPMSHQEFMRSDAARRRYWARSYVGWGRFAAARCNPAHVALARLERAGRVAHVITQNVDRLHQQAGSRRVLELHGSTHDVVCMGCGAVTPRAPLQDELARRNPAFAALAERDALRAAREGPGGDRGAGMQQQRPDGDAEVDEADFAAFDVPACSSCGGFLKPHVVFFGDNLPPGRTEQAMSIATDGADAVMVVGSSLMTLSSYRLVRAAAEKGSPVCILNVGETRADVLANLKVEARAGEILPRVEAEGGGWV